MQESVDLKEILLTHVLQYFKNHYDGFPGALEDLKTKEEKDCFIDNCKKIIDKGWAEEFDNNESLSFLKPYFNDTSKSLKINDAQRTIALYFIRRCLFKLVADACIQNTELNTAPYWFRDTNTKLNKEFEEILLHKKTTAYLYEGNKIYTLDTLNKLAEKNKSREIWGSAGLKGMVIFVAFFSLVKYIEKQTTSDIKRYIPYFLVLALIAFIANMGRETYLESRTQFFIDSRRTRLQNIQTQQQRDPELYTDKDIIKHIFVSEDDIKKLEATPNTVRAYDSATEVVRQHELRP